MSIDTDHDGTPNYLDLDSDGDGIPDAANPVFRPNIGIIMLKHQESEDESDPEGEDFLQFLQLGA